MVARVAEDPPRFVFLGTGTSAGVPAIGCSCAVCTSDDPRDQRTRTAGCLRFRDPSGTERVVLLDCGPDLRAQALREGLERCDAILFTHNHVDHTWGLDEVRRFNVVMGSPIDVYGERPTIDFLRGVYRHIFESRGNINQSFVAELLAHHVEPGRPFDLYGLRVTPIRFLHGRLPILGYRIEAGAAGLPGGDGPLPLAYCTDVSGVPPESWSLLEGLDTLVLDALRHRKHPTHMTLEQSVSVAEQIGARRTYFVHMSHDLGHEETNASLPDGMALAHDGLVVGETEGRRH